jgi:hypothetical protein
MYDEYDADLDELLEEAYLEGYYDSIDDYDDYYSEKAKLIYNDKDLDDMSLEELEALRRKELRRRNVSSGTTLASLAGVGVSGHGYKADRAAVKVFPQIELDNPDTREFRDSLVEDSRKSARKERNKLIASATATGINGSYNYIKRRNLKKIDRAIAKKRDNIDRAIFRKRG